jgi:hypothetical protein
VLPRGYAFDEVTHAYALGGRCVPSVTRVLDHAGLVSYDMVRKDILDRKSNLGTLVHRACEYYDQGDLDWSYFDADNPADQDVKGRLQAWASFRADTGFAPRLIEERYIAIFNGMSYGLTVDRLGFMRGTEAVVEIKNAASVEPWWAIQLAGYALGVPDVDGSVGPRSLFARRRRMVVQLFPDGRYKKYDFTEYQDAEVFSWTLGIAHWKLMKGSALRKIEEEK